MKSKLTALNPRKLNLSQTGSAIGLVLLVIVAAIATQGNFLSASNLTNVFRQVTIMGFASLGMCIVIITGNIDLSIIGNVSMTTVITAVLMTQGMPTPLIVLIVLLSGMAAGLINGVILSVWKIESFVVTMGMQVVCFGMAMLVSGNRTVIVPGNLLSQYTFLTNLSQWQITVIPKVLIFPVMFLIMLAFYLLFWVFTARTKMGRYIFALGGNEEVSYISGVNVTIVRIVSYVISGFTAAIAGIFMFSRSMCGDPTAGNSLGMYVVAAVVVGGTKMSGGRGNVLFNIMGIFVIGIINNLLNLVGAPYQLQQIIQGCIIILAVVMSSPKRK
ncbi:ABC transporter permease [Candidatus Allofournierella excrementavium]|uniref:ABC transporter permease n=1 Tax=Candidatus Allofournierella excrementavium TaxID=2838591 RepID=UPI003AB3A9BB